MVVEGTERECHASITCEALGIPLLIDRTCQAVHMMKNGMIITVDAAKGYIVNINGAK